MLFYDFEVFAYDWLVVIKDTDTEITHTIVNDRNELIKLYEDNRSNVWIGYNSKHYDQWILRGLLKGFNPKSINDFIINGGAGWKYDSSLNNVQLYNYDCMISQLYSLKQLEGFMGNDIRETTVSFNIDRKLTEQELQEVIFYCNHDVEQTMEVFLNTLQEFESQMSLISAFNMPLKNISKTKAQLSAMILECNSKKRNDEFNITIVDTLKLKKYKHIENWYRDSNNLNYKSKLKIQVAGVPHIFAWGGLHGARNNYIDEGIFINSDVGSFYPALMIEYDFLSRNVKDKHKYRKIRDKRLELKKAKNAMQQPYKIVLNSTYGASKDKHNPLYDPLQANNVCVNGQLLLLDLIEHLESHFKLIQSNTDGVMFKLNSHADISLYMKICDEWSNRTKMDLEHDYIKKVMQKDVNNYMIVMEDGSVKSKGAYVKKLSALDYDLAIVNKAVKNYFIDGTPVEETVNNCNDLIEFQKIVKVTNKFKYASHNGKALDGKVFRVFASRSLSDGLIYKHKIDSVSKVANTPDRCFIVNAEVNGVGIPRKLNRKWYIDMAKKRINDFKGVK